MYKEKEKVEFEETCQLFINSVNNYFGHLTGEVSQTSVPYLKTVDNVMLKDYTGMIGISGDRKGFVYISGDTNLYKELVTLFLDIEEPSSSDLLDMAGELSNVVSGNVRETYGKNFMISVPIVFKGAPEKLKFPKGVPIYVIPIKWKSHEAFIVIGLN
ncbi:chemotaxis protein CheX [Reichenbachiella faecimaris]|uniref:Chemotaxis protein CheX n=1 Tax=Reichenbachiella faecimaris TaxID=692418 RepID=A0A1W2GPZ7_REIFA|nr:chemotaxis protein CheX [Reichenbachiella faecimaris]SMD38346.1 chemotaxis protein CheX [Reichenbachiella faecimaris]